MKLPGLSWRRADRVMAKARADAFKVVMYALIQDLRSRDPEERKVAIETLRELGIFPAPGPPPSSLADVMRANRGIDD
jgi:hypothetical protein